MLCDFSIRFETDGLKGNNHLLDTPITLQVLARSVGDSVPIVTVCPRYYDLKYTECCDFDPEGPFPANETVWFGRHDGRLGE